MPEPNVIAPKARAKPTPAAPDTKWGVASLVCGIVGIIIPYIGLILGILAIVFSHRQKRIQPNGMATAGFVLGIIAIVIGLFVGMLVIIGSLAYFGVLSPDNFLPDKCTMNPPFACTEFYARGDALEFTIQNGAGVDLEGITVTASGCSPDAVVGTLINGDSVTAMFTCEPPEGDFRKSDINVAYTRDGVLHNAAGNIYVRVE